MLFQTGAQLIHSFLTQIGENQPLLHNAYVGFLEEGDPAYLGVAIENTNWFSRLFFSWVNPMMEKGYAGKIKSSDDLYDLPDNLDCKYISAKFLFHFDKGQREVTGKFLTKILVFYY